MTIEENMLKILEEELVVAQGCTEPIAAAYTAAVATRILDKKPERIKITASQNIVKNAKGVIIPGTGNLTGVEASAILGALVGDYHLDMEVLKNVTEEDVTTTRALLNTDFVTLEVIRPKAKLLMTVEVFNGDESASATIMHLHTNVIKIVKNGRIIKNSNCDETNFNSALVDRSCLTIQSAYDFANTVDLDKLELVEQQLKLNKEISEAGFANDYGVEVGQSNLKETNKMGLVFDIRRQAAACSAAGSDARMDGCTLPVMTVSGSGNQGITTSLPVYEYGKYLQVTDEKLLRATTFSNLVAIRIKNEVGRLAPVCGVVFAAIGAACGIMYLYDENIEVINKLIKNSIANNTGVICDGAKASCALKIYSAIDAALLSAQLAQHDVCVSGGTGIINDDVEQTIRNLKPISHAMEAVDSAIIGIMVDDNLH